MMVQQADSKVKSSYLSIFSPAAGGRFNGNTKTPRWPVLCKKGGATICGAGDWAVSAALASLMMAARFGNANVVFIIFLTSVSRVYKGS
jgi:hypothetical protein